MKIKKKVNGDDDEHPLDPDFVAEKSFWKDREVRYGEPDSIRVDVLENTKKGPVCVYDIKTGQSGLSLPRMAEIARNVKKHFPNKATRDRDQTGTDQVGVRQPIMAFRARAVLLDFTVAKPLQQRLHMCSEVDMFSEFWHRASGECADVVGQVEPRGFLGAIIVHAALTVLESDKAMPDRPIGGQFVHINEPNLNAVGIFLVRRSRQRRHVGRAMQLHR